MVHIEKRFEKDPIQERNKRILIGLIIGVIAIFCLYKFMEYKQNQITEISYPVCTYTQPEIVSKFKNNRYESTYTIKDYLYYGETLNFYSEPYSIGEKDFLSGKTVTLRNICNPKDEFVYMLENTVDGQIPVESLPVGMYEVFIMVDLNQNRAVSDEIIQDTFYTIRRNGVSKKVELISNQAMFDDENNKNVLDKNYIFLSVSEEVNEDIYDVVIDPGHGSYDTGKNPEFGGQANDLIEADENYKMALALQKELVQYGLKVLILRNSNEEIISTYGIDGRLHRAYTSDAKYYIELQMNYAVSPNYYGTQVAYSSWSSPKLASAIQSYLIENSDLISTGNTGKGKISGVVPSGRSGVYDGRMTIRESGGRILGAGSFSDKAIAGNASFSAEETHGLQAITIEYIYVSNVEDANRWKNNYLEYAKLTAEAFTKFLQIHK